MNQKIGKNDKYEEKKCLKEIPCSDPKSKTDFQKKLTKLFYSALQWLSKNKKLNQHSTTARLDPSPHTSWP